jgi:hypothetical protein
VINFFRAVHFIVAGYETHLFFLLKEPTDSVKCDLVSCGIYSALDVSLFASVFARFRYCILLMGAILASLLFSQVIVCVTEAAHVLI